MQAVGRMRLQDGVGGWPTQAAGDAIHSAANYADEHPEKAWERPGLPQARCPLPLLRPLLQGALQEHVPQKPQIPLLLLLAISNLVESGLLLKAWWRRSVRTRPDFYFWIHDSPLSIQQGSSEGPNFWSPDRTQHMRQGNLCLITSPLSCTIFPPSSFFKEDYSSQALLPPCCNYSIISLLNRNPLGHYIVGAIRWKKENQRNRSCKCLVIKITSRSNGQLWN